MLNSVTSKCTYFVVSDDHTSVTQSGCKLSLCHDSPGNCLLAVYSNRRTILAVYIFYFGELSPARGESPDPLCKSKVRITTMILVRSHGIRLRMAHWSRIRLPFASTGRMWSFAWHVTVNQRWRQLKRRFCLPMFRNWFNDRSERKMYAVTRAEYIKVLIRRDQFRKQRWRTGNVEH